MNNTTFLNVVPDAIPVVAGQWDHMEQWGISIATTFDPVKDLWINWSEEAAEHCLISHLNSQDLVISYNWDGFEKKILSQYGDVESIPAFCLMDQVQRDVGTRLKLQNLGNANQIESTKVGLPEFLRTFPDREERIGYNRNKIDTMSKLIEKALDRQTLWHYQVGEDRSPRRFYTGHWREILNNHSRKF